MQMRWFIATLLLLPAVAGAKTPDEVATHLACLAHQTASGYAEGWGKCAAFEAAYMVDVMAEQAAARQRKATADAERDAVAKSVLDSQ